MNETNGELKKVTIRSFLNNTFTQKNAKMPEFVLPINPETYSQNLKIQLEKKSGQGQSATDPRYVRTEPEELRLEFMFDGTDTLEGYVHKGKPVKEQINQFLDAVYFLEGTIHRPSFVMVDWGDYLKFRGVLNTVDINYLLFESNGDPLRAKVSATFLSLVAHEERLANERKSSPDLTHFRQVKADDRLDLMTQRIYNDSKFLLQVARANGLTTFRKIRAGQELIFPPIDKTEEV